MRVGSLVSFVTIVAAGFLLPRQARAADDLKEVVYVVEAQYHDQLRADMRKFADELRAAKLEDLSNIVRARADKGSGGSGWLYVEDGEPYVITNAHVVDQAATVTLKKERADAPGQFREIAQCDILYVDYEHDLAVIVPPPGYDLPTKGLEIGESPKTYGEKVWAAGYPGLWTNQQSWEFTDGTVNNARVASRELEKVRINIEYLILHSARINPGNSGGPLLAMRSAGATDLTRASSFRVIGVNTWSVEGNRYFAIPPPYIKAAIQEARNTKRLKKDPKLLTAKLEMRAQVLADKLGSPLIQNQGSEQEDEAAKLLSSMFASREGYAYWYAAVMRGLSQGRKEEAAKAIRLFVDHPAKVAGIAALHLFLEDLKSVRNFTAIRYRKIEQDSLNRMGTDEHAPREFLTIFDIDNRRHDLRWTFEYGQWRVSNTGFDHGQGTRSAPMANALSTQVGGTPAAQPAPAIPPESDQGRRTLMVVGIVGGVVLGLLVLGALAGGSSSESASLRIGF